MKKTENQAGKAALDYANTVYPRFQDSPADKLQSYEGIVEWHQGQGLLTPGDAKRMLAATRKGNGRITAAFNTGLALRETIYRIFQAVARGRPPAENDMAALNDAISEQRKYQHLAMQGRGAEWQWRFDPNEPRSLFGPVIMAAAELLTSDKLDRVRECPAPDGCGWLFLDTSRNSSRRWCSMSDCGNLAKVRRHRQRHH